jgi:protein-arginine kinase activator protein McsA
MTTKSVFATELEVGMKLALPFGRTATISDKRVGTRYIHVSLDDTNVRTSFDISQEVLIDVTEKQYLVCHECGEVFDNIQIASEHGCVGPEYSIVPESEAL